MTRNLAGHVHRAENVHRHPKPFANSVNPKPRGPWTKKPAFLNCPPVPTVLQYPDPFTTCPSTVNPYTAKACVFTLTNRNPSRNPLSCLWILFMYSKFFCSTT